MHGIVRLILLGSFFIRVSKEVYPKNQLLKSDPLYNEVMKNVEKIVAKLSVEQIEPISRMFDLDGKFGIDIEMDSVDVISILLAIQEELGVLISEKEIAFITTPRELIAHIQKSI